MRECEGMREEKEGGGGEMVTLVTTYNIVRQKHLVLMRYFCPR